LVAFVVIRPSDTAVDDASAVSANCSVQLNILKCRLSALNSWWWSMDMMSVTYFLF